MTSIRRTLILVAFTATTLLAACGQSSGPATVAPHEITRDTSCSLDGMLLADYPGPKAQIFYAGQAEPDFFCDTVEMFHVYLTPEQVRDVRGIFVQDMGKAALGRTARPLDRREDPPTTSTAASAKGSMGPTIASFALEQDAAKFVAEYGGKVYRFADITARHGRAGWRRAQRQPHVSNTMPEFFESVAFETATEIEQLARLAYELRENRQAVLQFHGSRTKRRCCRKSSPARWPSTRPMNTIWRPGFSRTPAKRPGLRWPGALKEANRT